MLTEINPKLPMRNKNATRDYYIKQLGFQEIGDYEGYLTDLANEFVPLGKS